MLLKALYLLSLTWMYVHVESLKKDWNLKGKPGDGYYIAVDIGTPPQKFNLLIDTGSSNLAIAGASYPGIESFFSTNKSTSYINNGSDVKVTYTQGWWEGYLGVDVVNLPTLINSVPVNTSLSIITDAHGFYINNSHWEGILGLAFKDLAIPSGITPWFDALTNKTSQNQFSLELCGPMSRPDHNKHFGRLAIGSLSCQNSIYWTPVNRRWFYEVSLTSVWIAKQRMNIPCTDLNYPKTIIDSGTSFLKFSSRSYSLIIWELKSIVSKQLKIFPDEFWSQKRDYCIATSQKLPWHRLPSLQLFLQQSNSSHFGVTLPPSAFFRVALNTSNATHTCWSLGIEQGPSGTVLGAVFLEGLCATFDKAASRIYFQESSCGPNVKLSLPSNKTDSVTCHYSAHVVNGPLILACVFLVLVLLPLVMALARWLWLTHIRPRLYTRLPFITLQDSSPPSS